MLDDRNEKFNRSCGRDGRESWPSDGAHLVQCSVGQTLQQNSVHQGRVFTFRDDGLRLLGPQRRCSNNIPIADVQQE